MSAKEWVVEKYPYNSDHLLNSLDWLDRIAPESPEALRLAALTHDMERAFPGPDQPVAKSLVDPAYHAAHAGRSARIVGEWLRGQGADERLAGEVEALIRVHEDGGSPEANLVQAADSLSFLDCNVDLFLSKVREGKCTAQDVRAKFDYSYQRIQVPGAKELALPMLERAKARLSALESELSKQRATRMPEPDKVTEGIRSSIGFWVMLRRLSSGPARTKRNCTSGRTICIALSPSPQCGSTWAGGG